MNPQIDHYTGWLLPNDDQPLIYRDRGNPVLVEKLPNGFLVQDSVSPKEIHLRGSYDLHHNHKYGSQIQLKWMRGADPVATSWELWVGVRMQGRIIGSTTIKTLDYSTLGITDIVTDLESVGIFPECGIMINRKGAMWFVALFPALDNLAYDSHAVTPGYINFKPWMDIEVLPMVGDFFYATQNRDWETACDGSADGTSGYNLTVPGMINSERDPDVERLFFKTMDRITSARVLTYTRY